VQTRPAVAKFSSGGFVVVWESEAEFGAMTDIVGRRFSSAGAPLTDDFVVEGDTTEDHSVPSISSLGGDGGFVVTWQAIPATTFQVFARRFDATGAPTGPAARVNTTNTSAHFNSVVGGDADGNSVVVWEAEDGDLYGIFGRRYDATGAALGDEFRVNTYTTLDAIFPRVAMTAGGAFTVTWYGTAPAVGQGAIVKRYCPLAGDADGNDAIALSDVFYLINNLFAGGPQLVHPADANGDGNVDVADVFFLINYLFAAGPAPACVP